MRTKQASAAKRSQLFSKLAKELTVAAKEGGPDQEMNPRLRTVIEKAREVNMPSENIERAIKKATGADAGQLEEILVEAYGPGGVALLISAITDNRNRTLGEIKQILQKNGGKMVEGGAVQWLFEKKGVATIEPAEGSFPPPREELELAAIEAGAEDMRWREETLEAYVPAAQLSSFKEKFSAYTLSIATSLDWVPKEQATAPEGHQEAIGRLLEALDEHEDVQDVYSTL